MCANNKDKEGLGRLASCVPITKTKRVGYNTTMTSVLAIILEF